MICSICLGEHRASSCKQRIHDGSTAQRFAAGMAAAREVPDPKPSNDSENWKRLQEAMRRGM